LHEILIFRISPIYYYIYMKFYETKFGMSTFR